MENGSQDKGLGTIDTLFVCILAGILIAVAFYYVHRVVLEAKGIEMKAELQSIRTAVNAYRAMHDNRKPESLRTLITETYVVHMDKKYPQARPFERHYLEAYALDKEGYPIDPFGNRYRYDPKTGDAASGTVGYESW